MPVSAHDVARELRRRLPGAGTVKIHKLLYFAQGWHLAWFSHALFHESIEAWNNGPVVADLWHAENKNRPVPQPIPLAESEMGTVGYVVARYGSLNGQDLIRLTHNEGPWVELSERDDPFAPMNPEITETMLRDYFSGDEKLGAIDQVKKAAFADDAVREVLVNGFHRSDNEPVEADDREAIRALIREKQG